MISKHSRHDVNFRANVDDRPSGKQINQLYTLRATNFSEQTIQKTRPLPSPSTDKLATAARSPSRSQLHRASGSRMPRQFLKQSPTFMIHESGGMTPTARRAPLYFHRGAAAKNSLNSADRVF